jgi:hypothetical protein
MSQDDATTMPPAPRSKMLGMGEDHHVSNPTGI